MRYWQVRVSAGGGRPFGCKVEKIAPERVVLRTEQALPKGMACSVQIEVPALGGRRQPVTAGLSGDVEHAIFSGGKVRLSLKVNWLSVEAKRLIEDVTVRP